MRAQISEVIPFYGHPSSTATNLLVFLTDLMIVSLSNGLKDLKLMTSQLIPSFSNSLAASKEYFTIFAKATIVTSLPKHLRFLKYPHEQSWPYQ